jgi:hypothetical protein
VSKKLIGFNGHDIASYWHDHGDGTWAIEKAQQDLTPLLDRNKVYQNHGGGMKWSDELGDEKLGVRMVASIPMIVIDRWRKEFGIDYFDPDPEVQKRIDRLLDSNEWRYLRTDNSKLE